MRVPILLTLVLLLSCGPKKGMTESDQMPPPEINCPEGGDCIFEVLQNSQLELRRDAFGKLFPEVIDGKNLVLRFEFKKDQLPETRDSSYSEFLFLELEEQQTLISLKDEELQKVKMTFGRICYCKGSTGYFPVKKGHLLISRSEGSIMIKTGFRVGKVPQILTEIEETIDFYPKN